MDHSDARRHSSKLNETLHCFQTDVFHFGRRLVTMSKIFAKVSVLVVLGTVMGCKARHFGENKY